MPQLLYISGVSPGQRKRKKRKASHPTCVSVCAFISAIRIRGHLLVAPGDRYFGRIETIHYHYSLFQSRLIVETLVWLFLITYVECSSLPIASVDNPSLPHLVRVPIQRFHSHHLHHHHHHHDHSQQSENKFFQPVPVL
ncbi:hypothetical protein K440DRAFT_239660 [Wilcoxina mikolae CBS 423.85]|nr:hypothetical protein K440DRAFT_239660 [Wilcoxina mikolae CBS 423.85]